MILTNLVTLEPAKSPGGLNNEISRPDFATRWPHGLKLFLKFYLAIY